jgi:hypothetical protein
MVRHEHDEGPGRGSTGGDDVRSRGRRRKVRC